MGLLYSLGVGHRFATLRLGKFGGKVYYTKIDLPLVLENATRLLKGGGGLEEGKLPYSVLAVAVKLVAKVKSFRPFRRKVLS